MRQVEYMRLPVLPGELESLNSLGREGWRVIQILPSLRGEVVYLERELFSWETKDALDNRKPSVRGSKLDGR